MGVLLRGGGRVGETRGCRGEGGGGGGGRRKWLELEKSLDWVLLKLLLLMMMVVVVLLMMVEQMVMVVMLQWHPVVTQPVLGGLGQGLKSSSDPSLSLHELLDGWAVLRLVLLLLLLLLLMVVLMDSGGSQAHNISTIVPDHLSSDHSHESLI